MVVVLEGIVFGGPFFLVRFFTKCFDWTMTSFVCSISLLLFLSAILFVVVAVDKDAEETLLVDKRRNRLATFFKEIAVRKKCQKPFEAFILYNYCIPRIDLLDSDNIIANMIEKFERFILILRVRNGKSNGVS